MAADSPDLKYTKEHEWMQLSDDKIATVGITHFAQEQLGDVVYVELSGVGGGVVKQGEPFGVVESTKAVSELFAPVAGTVVEQATRRAWDHRRLHHQQGPYEESWLVRIEVSAPCPRARRGLAAKFAAESLPRASAAAWWRRTPRLSIFLLAAPWQALDTVPSRSQCCTRT